MQSKAVQFRPLALHIFAGNALPFTGPLDQASRERLGILEFKNQCPERDRIADIGERIAAEELPALVKLAISGASLFIKNGGAYTIPPSSEALLNRWMIACDPIEQFVDERLVADTDGFVHRAHLYTRFEEWATEEGWDARSKPRKREFYERLEKILRASPTHSKDGKVRGYRGWRARTPADGPKC